ncbi:MAG TPA: flagellin [Candidatus Binatia bacterium]|nr:flagellin [Candidatus Binatia bacterium]
MALDINTNISSLNAQRHLEESGDALTTSLERLSSGVRINNAYDDAAGLAIADKLNRDARVAAQAIRNANDGISALSIGEKALGNVSSILSRLSELASQSASGSITDTQRSAIQNEFAALLSEIARISTVTTFNGVQLLSAGTTVALQVGLDGTSNSQINFTTVDGSVSGILSVSQTSIAASTAASAQSALGLLTSAIANVAQTRGVLGAAESRLLQAVANLRIAQENFQAAEGRIRDTDVAAETANLTRASVLRQAGVAVLAQANQQPSLALQLLR